MRFTILGRDGECPYAASAHGFVGDLNDHSEFDRIISVRGSDSAWCPDTARSSEPKRGPRGVGSVQARHPRRGTFSRNYASSHGGQFRERLQPSRRVGAVATLLSRTFGSPWTWSARFTGRSTW